MVLGVFLVLPVVIHGQSLRYPQESVYCMRSIGGYKVRARRDDRKNRATDGRSGLRIDKAIINLGVEGRQ
jgi:hypothetical protein